MLVDNKTDQNEQMISIGIGMFTWRGHLKLFAIRDPFDLQDPAST
jgi:hypothetical protein